MFTPPGQLDELVVDGASHEHRIAVLEILCQVIEAHDFGWAYEGEILGIEINDFPFSGKRAFGDVFEGRDTVFFGLIEAGLDAGDLEGFEFIAYSFHLSS